MDRDKEAKEKGKEAADRSRHAKEANIAVGDRVLAKRLVKTNKWQSNFVPIVETVVDLRGDNATIQ